MLTCTVLINAPNTISERGSQCCTYDINESNGTWRGQLGLDQGYPVSSDAVGTQTLVPPIPMPMLITFALLREDEHSNIDAEVSPILE